MGLNNDKTFKVFCINISKTRLNIASHYLLYELLRIGDQ